MESYDLAKKIAAILDSKKATDIRVLKIKEISSLGDYFVLASANNSSLVQALSDEIDFRLGHEDGVAPRRIEGYSSAKWILMDYADVIVHIFYEETRQFYSLERLWSDAKVEEVAFPHAEPEEPAGK
ncbi:MAG TPA: ribosome silencing factor [Oscillospiraceae bacterium]|nr:ribosome silencing factor [Oscillospiraceae bacterium]HNW04679.1 ribosome silencing factor [Oscillospiraceae bacterium]HPV99906.1 ribosome silencing factor [Oscillospiraceae bacterium]